MLSTFGLRLQYSIFFFSLMLLDILRLKVFNRWTEQEVWQQLRILKVDYFVFSLGPCTHERMLCVLLVLHLLLVFDFEACYFMSQATSNAPFPMAVTLTWCISSMQLTRLGNLDAVTQRFGAIE